MPCVLGSLWSCYWLQFNHTLTKTAEEGKLCRSGLKCDHRAIAHMVVGNIAKSRYTRIYFKWFPQYRNLVSDPSGESGVKSVLRVTAYEMVFLMGCQERAAD